MRHAPSPTAGLSPRPPRLGDFTTDRRVLILAAMALFVGCGGVASAWVLLRLIALVSNLVWFGRLSAQIIPLSDAAPSAWMVAAPAVGGLLVGLIARFGSEKIRGHGIPEAIEAILIGGSRMQPKVALFKPLSSAIAIGTGGPFGAEGPIIMTGGAIGSLFAQFFRLTAAERKTLLVAGAAAGMTAIFGTPLAAILLAVELLLFEWKPRSLIPVAVACLVAAGLRPLVIGSGPLFPFLGNPAAAWWVLLAAGVLGIVAGLQSGLMTLLLYKAEDLFGALPLHWMWWPAIGGLAVGLGGLADPRALGVGYDVIRDLLSSHLVLHDVIVLLLAKSVIWVIALASGTSGGVLAPLLIMGGAAGWLEGHLMASDPAFWALLGMAAMMGGTMRAPLTGVAFAIELTGDFGAVLPLMTATFAAYGLTVLLLKRSILTEKIARRGQHLTREYSTDPFELLRASDVMVKDVATVPANLSIAEVVDLFTTSEVRHKSYPIVAADGRLVGIVSRADALRWRVATENSEATLADLITDEAVTVAYTDDVLSRVADLMVANDLGRLPVVARSDGRLVGLVARKDLLRSRMIANAQERERLAYFGHATVAAPNKD